MAAKVICPYCGEESNGPGFLENLKDNLESFYALSTMRPLIPPILGPKTGWVTIKCSECGREFLYNRRTRGTAT